VGALPCISLLKAKAMTFVRHVIIFTMPCWIRLIYVSWNLKYSNYFYRISYCAQVRLSSIWILTSWIWLMESTSVALTFSIVSMRLLWVIFNIHLSPMFPTLLWDWTKASFAFGYVFFVYSWLCALVCS
jgi:hypothetical protein